MTDLAILAARNDDCADHELADGILTRVVAFARRGGARAGRLTVIARVTLLIAAEVVERVERQQGKQAATEFRTQLGRKLPRSPQPSHRSQDKHESPSQ